MVTFPEGTFFLFLADARRTELLPTMVAFLAAREKTLLFEFIFEDKEDAGGDGDG